MSFEGVLVGGIKLGSTIPKSHSKWGLPHRTLVVVQSFIEMLRYLQLEAICAISCLLGNQTSGQIVFACPIKISCFFPSS